MALVEFVERHLDSGYIDVEVRIDGVDSGQIHISLHAWCSLRDTPEDSDVAAVTAIEWEENNA